MTDLAARSAVSAPTRPTTLHSKSFDDHVEGLMSQWKVPGLAIAIIDGQSITVKNYGFADLQAQRRVDDGTIFNCASTSKSFTAASVALIIEEEQKSKSGGSKPRGFTTPVKDFLPDDFVLSDQYCTDNVTVEDILGHRSGMPRYDDSYLGIRARNTDSPRSVTRNLRNLELSKPLRTTYQYCNMMYTVGTHLVQELSGMSFGNFLQKRFWDPLGMSSTYLDAPSLDDFETLKSKIATGYFWSEEKSTFTPMPFYSEPEALGAGSIYSTVSDYAKWVRCMLTKSPPLSEESHAELVKPRIICDPEKEPKHGFSHMLYCLGWETQSYRGHQIIGHDGCVTGFNSNMKFIPSKDWGVVVFNNGDLGAADCHQIIVKTLVDDLLQIRAEERVNWNEIHKADFQESKEEYKEEQAKEDELDEGEDDDQLSELDLQAYAGVYYNKGYHSLRLKLKEDRLHADCTDRSFQFHIRIRRKKGNHFTAKLRDDFGSDSTSIKVRFALAQDVGRVDRFGIKLEDALDDELIWFERVADEDPRKLD